MDCRPESFPVRKLLAVTGMSPQIVTETLYYLACRRDPPFIPTEIHVLTTRKGKQTAIHSLLEGRNRQFFRFCEEYGLAGRIAFDAGRIREITDKAGAPLDDILTEEHSLEVGDAVINWIREHTLDERCAVHVSLAGGRKTLGFFAGYALSLFGRLQDRLSHVLVTPPFESSEEFYFIPRTPAEVKLRDGNLISTREADIMLADIPFVRLRRYVQSRLLGKRSGFNEIVEATQKALDSLRVILSIARKSVKCGAVEIELPTREFAFYAWLAYRRRENIRHGEIHWKEVEEADLRQFRRIYNLARGEDDPAAIDAPLEDLRIEHEAQEKKKFFEETCSNLRKEFEKRLGDAAEYYGIAKTEKKPRRNSDGGTNPHDRLEKYYVPLSPQQIGWEDDPFERGMGLSPDHGGEEP
jgi:CRISPR-associated protein (TIGR02584 family)